MNIKRIIIGALLVASLGLAGCFGPGGGWGYPNYGYPAYAGAPIYERNVYPAYRYGGWAHPSYDRAGWGGWHGPGAYGYHHGNAVAHAGHFNRRYR